MCRLSWNVGASTSCYPLGLSRPVMGLLCYGFIMPLSWQHLLCFSPGRLPLNILMTKSASPALLSQSVHIGFLPIASVIIRQTGGHPSSMKCYVTVTSQWVDSCRELIKKCSVALLRPLGRPGRWWEDNIKMYLQEVWCSGMDWIELAQDRDRW